MKGSLYISVKSSSSKALFNATISLLIFCLQDLPIFDNGVLKSPTIIMLLSISFLKSSKIFKNVFGCSYVGCIYIYNVYVFLVDSSFEYYEVTIWVSLYGPLFEVYFVWYEYCYPRFFFPVRLLGKFVSSLSLSVCVSVLSWGGSLVGNIYVGHVFLSIQLFYVFWLEHLIHLHLRLLLIGIYSLPILCTCVLPSFSLFLPSLTAAPLACLAELVWWMYILLDFFCLGNSLFGLLSWWRAFLGKVVLVAGLWFSSLGILFAILFWLGAFPLRSQLLTLSGIPCMLLPFFPLLPLRFFLCLGILPF